MLNLWWAYYQCEPFGSHWEQVAMLAAMQQANNAMMAATHGVKMETLSVADFLPRDSMPWIKRTKLKRGITHPKAQTDIIKQAFGFR